MKLCSSAIFVVIYFLAAIVSNDLLFSVSFFSFILTNMKFAHTLTWTEEYSKWIFIFMLFLNYKQLIFIGFRSNKSNMTLWVRRPTDSAMWRGRHINSEECSREIVSASQMIESIFQFIGIKMLCGHILLSCESKRKTQTQNSSERDHPSWCIKTDLASFFGHRKNDLTIGVELMLYAFCYKWFCLGALCIE